MALEKYKVFTTIPNEFRSASKALCFSQTSLCIYDKFDCEYIPRQWLLEASKQEMQHFFETKTHSEHPIIIILYESLFSRPIREKISLLKEIFNNRVKTIHITEDLHNIKNQDIREAYISATLTLSRFPIHHDIFPELDLRKQVPFHLFCPDQYLQETSLKVTDQRSIFQYGALNVDSPGINKSFWPESNQYYLRAKWDQLLNNSSLKYAHISINQKNLVKIRHKFCIGFTCSYLPLRFQKKVIEAHSQDQSFIDFRAPSIPLTRGYLVAKYFEIPGMGFLLLSDDHEVKDQLESLGFKDGYNYISISEDDWKEKIHFIEKAGNSELSSICEEGHRLVSTSHTREARAIQLQKIVGELMQTSS